MTTGPAIVRPSPAAAVWTLALLAAAFATLHLPYLARALEDIDSINFALGIRDYDPAAHRPHPPGYPIYIVVGKAATALVGALSPAESGASEARALAWISLVSALVAIPLLWRLFGRILTTSVEGDARAVALGATALTATTPLFWYMAARPMSDMPGLAVATAAQAILAAAWWHQRPGAGGDVRMTPVTTAASGRLIVLGALAAGVAVGFRSQVAWMTLPLLLLVLADRIGRGVAGAMIGAGVAFTAGALLWAVPMVAASGGLGAYLAALGDQGGEDFAGVDMLYQRPSPRLLALALQRTLVFPWDSYALAAVVLALGVAGLAWLAWRDRRAAVFVIALAAPYGAFHLAFHDTAFVRYALPLVPAAAVLAAIGARALFGRAAPLAVAGLVVWSVTIAQPVLAAYGDDDGPAASALAAMEDAAAAAPPGAVTGHHPFRRPLEATPPEYAPRLRIAPRREWLEVVRYWRDGAEAPLWFLADPRRFDLALFDPIALADRTAFHWDLDSLSHVGGMRPADAVWHRMSPPGWMLAEGWALTPETAGMAALGGHAPHLAPVTGYVARRSSPVRVMIGGRHLGAAGGPPARFTLALDAVTVDEWDAGAGFFLRFIDVAAGRLEGDGPYATLMLGSAAEGAIVPTAIEQFDLQSPEAVMWGYGEGWHEAELDPVRAEMWRWTSDRAVVEWRGAVGDRTLTLTGASPLRDFTTPPTVVVRTGDVEVARFSPSDAFREVIALPAAALAGSGGRVTIETDLTFMPAGRGGPDRRRLGLRILSLDLR